MEIARWQQTVDVMAAASGYRFEYVPVVPGSGSHFTSWASSTPSSDITVNYASATDPNGYQLLTLGNPQTVAETALSWIDVGTGPKFSTSAEIDMDFSDLQRATRTRMYSSSDRVSLMIHEFGHALGLGHRRPDGDDVSRMAPRQKSTGCGGYCTTRIPRPAAVLELNVGSN